MDIQTPEEKQAARALFQKISRTTMPFGRYKDLPLVDLPEPYLVWFAREGFPEGELGQMLAILHEVKVNGLEYLFRGRGGPRARPRPRM